jgi:hypothetical protein
MNVKEYLNEYYSEEEILIFDGFDEAFIGVGYQFHKAVACYNEDKFIELLMSDGMTYEEAVEYFEFNVAGSYMGDRTPIFFKEGGLI